MTAPRYTPGEAAILAPPRSAADLEREEDRAAAAQQGQVDWTGPREEDLDPHTGHWIGPLPIPSERFPFCWPEEHEACCTLRNGGRFCDCVASDAGAEQDAPAAQQAPAGPTVNACQVRAETPEDRAAVASVIEAARAHMGAVRCYAVHPGQAFCGRREPEALTAETARVDCTACLEAGPPPTTDAERAEWERAPQTAKMQKERDEAQKRARFCAAAAKDLDEERRALLTERREALTVALRAAEELDAVPEDSTSLLSVLEAIESAAHGATDEIAALSESEPEAAQQAPALERKKCDGCGAEIDPETCWCGDPVGAHNGPAMGHAFVAMGCRCYEKKRIAPTTFDPRLDATSPVREVAPGVFTDDPEPSPGLTALASALRGTPARRDPLLCEAARLLNTLTDAVLGLLCHEDGMRLEDMPDSIARYLGPAQAAAQKWTHEHMPEEWAYEAATPQRTTEEP